jgi:CheY-like chemotaxis protein
MAGKILIVDDELLSSKIIANYLQDINYSVEEARSGAKALELLNAHPQDYQIVIVDRMMFGIDGMEVLRRIKQSPELKHIPVIMQTGEAEAEDSINAMAAGAFAFVFKPIEHDALLLLIKSALTEYNKHRN